MEVVHRAQGDAVLHLYGALDVHLVHLNSVLFGALVGLLNAILLVRAIEQSLGDDLALAITLIVLEVALAAGPARLALDLVFDAFQILQTLCVLA